MGIRIAAQIDPNKQIQDQGFEKLSAEWIFYIRYVPVSKLNKLTTR